MSGWVCRSTGKPVQEFRPFRIAAKLPYHKAIPKNRRQVCFLASLPNRTITSQLCCTDTSQSCCAGGLCRLLLCHAVQGAETPDQLRAVDAHDLAIAEELRERSQRDAIVRVVEGRHQDEAVRYIEVRVARRDACAVEYQGTRHRQPYDLQPCAPQGDGIRRVRFLHEHHGLFI